MGERRGNKGGGGEEEDGGRGSGGSGARKEPMERYNEGGNRGTGAREREIREEIPSNAAKSIRVSVLVPLPSSTGTDAIANKRRLSAEEAI